MDKPKKEKKSKKKAVGTPKKEGSSKRDKKSKKTKILSFNEFSDLSYLDIISSDDDTIRESANKYMGIRKVPKLKANFVLYPHHETLLRWLHEREKSPFMGITSGLINAEMGLGKTMTTALHILSHPRTIEDDIPPGDPEKDNPDGFDLSLKSIKEKKLKIKGPTLVVCKKTVATNWLDDLSDHFGANWVKENILVFHRELGKLDEITKESIENAEIVITTYEAVKSGYSQYIEDKKKNNLIKLYTTEWLRIVLDESQEIANTTTDNHKACIALVGIYKSCLTGTRFRNCRDDLLSQLGFLGLYPFPAKRSWGAERFKELGLDEVVNTMNYKSAGIELPPCEQMEVEVELGKEERKLYDLVLAITRNLYEALNRQQYTNDEKEVFSHANILELILYLREICVRPDLLIRNPKKGSMMEKIENIKNKSKLGEWLTNPEGTAGLKSAKTKAIINLLNTKELKNEKVVIFSMFTSYLGLIKDHIIEKTGRNCIILDGSTKGPVRRDIIGKFNRDKTNDGDGEDNDVLLVNYRVGGVGVNIQKRCHTIIFVEEWWTYTVIEQALKRVARFGQTEKVTAYFLKAKDTLEEHMIKICQEKVQLSEEFFGTSTVLPKQILGRLLEPVDSKSKEGGRDRKKDKDEDSSEDIEEECSEGEDN